MRNLYSILTQISFSILWVTQFFNKKMHLFVKGRVGLLKKLSEAIQPSDKIVWFHCASLGEFEQGLPIMKAVKAALPEYKILITFFSPSGYEVKKNTDIADFITYLPSDTISNARKFVEIVHPALAIFVKYEFWPNYLFELERAEIPVILVSGLFRKQQSFFSGHGFFMRKALRTMDHIFVQDESSMKLLESIDIRNVTLSGDTRFDRVANQVEQNNSLDFAREFKQDNLCIVCGSTWPEDEDLLIPFIEMAGKEIRFIVAPHSIDGAKIERFRSKLSKTSVLYSAREEASLSEAQVLIVDTIGLLTKLYSYADIAYVGGGMGSSGLHNILEPATFGVPIVIGKNFEKFPEAKQLQTLGALFSVATPEDLEKVINKLISEDAFRTKSGAVAGDYVNMNTGAMRITMDYIKKLHSDGSI